MNINNVNYITVTAYPKILCRWWLKSKQENNIAEFYVPWWAWPMEFIHRIIFGASKIRR